MRLFGSERLMNIFNTLGVADGEEIQHKMLSSAIERAQTKIENNNFGIRKNLLEYDQVMNEQRELVYAQRGRVLEGENMKDQILDMIRQQVDTAVDSVFNDGVDRDEWDLGEFNHLLQPVVPIKPISPGMIDEVKDTKELADRIYDQAIELYDKKEKEFENPEQFREVERIILLRVIDMKWMEEIDDMDQLRQSIGLQAFAQRNPVDEYKMISYDMMDEMNAAIRTETVQTLYRIRVERKVEREEVAKVTGNGVVKGVKAGTVKITMMVLDVALG